MLLYGVLNEELIKSNKVKLIDRDDNCFCWQVSEDVWFFTTKVEEQKVPEYIRKQVENITQIKLSN